MNQSSFKVFKYELLNTVRNRWLAVCSVLVFFVTVGFIKVSGDFDKALLSMTSLSVVGVPLVTVLFSSLYWYYNDRFTQLLLTLPVKRQTLYVARYLSHVGALALCWVGGVTLGFLVYLHFSAGIVLLSVLVCVLVCVFVAITMAVCAKVSDRMKGMGLLFGLWLYFALIHDGLILLILFALRDYPLDSVSGALGVLNPIGLARVVSLMHYESAMLLGHAGALVRNLLTSSTGLVIALAVGLVWVIVPAVIGLRIFQKKDF